MKKLPIIIILILFLSSFMLVFARNPFPIDITTFFIPTSTQNSDWNVSENGSLMQNWSVIDIKDAERWNRSSDENQIVWWLGTDTIVFNDSDGSVDFSALLANNSESNRSQSLLWTYVNSSSPDSEYVYTGPCFFNTTSGNATMILYGDNSTFVLNRGFFGGAWQLVNTEDYSYGAHGGIVINP